MGQTMVEKIVSRQVGRPVQIGEKIERLPITKLFFNDVIGPPAIGFVAHLWGLQAAMLVIALVSVAMTLAARRARLLV